MKLSDAIRLGAMLRPQGYGDFFTTLPDGSLTSCALGAAAEAVGVPRVTTEALASRWPELDGSKRLSCPACTMPDEYGCTIAHLNDMHSWSRERIANWLDTLDDDAKVAERQRVAATV